MKQLCILAALAALWGCRAAQQEARVPISFATTEQTTNQSKALASGDIVGLFATIDGTERYLMENTPFAVGADGRSLSTTPAVYYPDRKEAMNFYAYFPYGSGTSFSVPSDQSTASALQAADLCWAKASSTPIASAVPLQFEHKMARLVVAANQTPSKIMAPNAFSGGLLDIRTGLFTNTIKSSVSTTGNELILPAQTVTRLVLTVAGVEYVFEGAIALEAAKTTTANLTLNVVTKTATLSGSSTTAWTSTASQGNPTQTVSNVLTLHWAPRIHTRSVEVDKIVFTVKDLTNGTTAAHTVTTNIQFDKETFVVPFLTASLTYPYKVEKIDLYKSTALIQSCTHLLGQIISKSGASTIGIRDVPNAILINGLWWATGNLIADGANGCKIGSEKDHGIVFQFGSLLGWKAGDLASKGSGQGLANIYENAYWGGGNVFNFTNEIAVKPLVFRETLTAWPNENTSNTANPPSYYFGFTGTHNGINYSQDLTDIRDYPGLADGSYAEKGLGDPCTYYLGVGWRTPSVIQFRQLLALGNRPSSTYEGFTGCWAGPGTTLSTGLFFVFSRTSTKWDSGTFCFATLSRTCAYNNTTSLFNAKDVYQMFINTGYAEVQTNGLVGHSRSRAQAVRCVFDQYKHRL